MVEEWCGDSDGALLPRTIVPLWDAELAAKEVRRNAERDVRAVCFSEIPPHLGLPSIHSGEGDPFIAACQDTPTVICIHIGPSPRLPAPSSRSPVAAAAPDRKRFVEGQRVSVRADLSGRQIIKKNRSHNNRSR